MPIAVSVVIPTYNRMDILPQVLDGLAVQAGAPPFEVVVVDDGSTDDTPTYLGQRSAAGLGAASLRVLRQANQGPAAARNRGVASAQGALVAFLGDDTVPSAGWLARHMEAHDARRSAAPVAVIGHTAWHPRMRLTPFLRYINDHGLQFGYALIEDPENVPFNFLYTSNLSLPRSLLEREPFDLRFPYAAWEDIELSYRLHRRGLRLVYEPAAKAAHDHPTDLGRFAVRQEKAGYCAVVFHRLHPELGPFLGLGPDGPPALPSTAVQHAREALARLLQKIPVRVPRLWEDVLRYHYIRGLHRGWRDLARTEEGDNNERNESRRVS